mgnify:CR=1 FL=1
MCSSDLDQGDFLGRFDHAPAHHRRGDIDEFHIGQGRLELLVILHGQVVGLDADAAAIRNQPLDRGEVVVPHPVRVDQVAALAAPVGLATVDRSEERRVGKECRSRWSPYH